MAQFRTGEFSFCLFSELPQISKLQRASTVAIKFCLFGSHYYCGPEDYRVSRPEKKRLLFKTQIYQNVHNHHFWCLMFFIVVFLNNDILLLSYPVHSIYHIILAYTSYLSESKDCILIHFG